MSAAAFMPDGAPILLTPPTEPGASGPDSPQRYATTDNEIAVLSRTPDKTALDLTIYDRSGLVIAQTQVDHAPTGLTTTAWSAFALHNGSVVVEWTDGTNGDSQGTDPLHAAIYAPDASLVGSYIVNSTSSGAYPEGSFATADGYELFWHATNVPPGYGFEAQRFDDAGNPTTGVNDIALSAPLNGASALGPGGSYLEFTGAEGTYFDGVHTFSVTLPVSGGDKNYFAGETAVRLAGGDYAVAWNVRGYVYGAGVAVFHTATHSFSSAHGVASDGSDSVSLLALPDGGFAVSSGTYTQSYDGQDHAGSLVRLSGQVAGITATGDLYTIAYQSSGYVLQDYAVSHPDPTSLSISGPPATAEGNNGTTDFAFTVTRSGDTTGSPLVDWYLSTDGSPTSANPSDFSGATAGTVYFQPGQTTATIHIAVNGDTAVEPDETFHVRLTNSRGATLTNNDVTATIVNDDSASGGGGSGQTFTSDNNGDHWTGTAGNDTFNLGRGGDVVTGNGGNDLFAFAETPWAGAHITDFNAGDVVDLTGLLAKSGYTGSDPVGAGYIKITDDGAGDAQVWSHLPSGWWLVATLDQVAPSAVQMQGDQVVIGSASPPGQTYTSDNNGDTWTGTAGNDTFHLGRGGDVVTGGAGADTFAFAETPWAGAEIKDFSHTDGDRIDLSGLLTRSGYTGSDPFADQYLKFTTSADGSAQVWSDTHQPGNDGWWLVATVDGVPTSSLHYSGGLIT